MKVVFRCDPNLREFLPPPVAARSVLPQWLRDMPAKAFSEFHQRSIRTVKQCPPFIDAMTYGFMILLPCDVTVEGGRFAWEWDIPMPAAKHHPRAPLSFHVREQMRGAPLSNERAAIKFNSFWTVELEAGWSLFATHPANRDDLPFRTVTGIVDCDRFHDAGINFPATWIDADFDGVLSRGTPVAQCFPVPRVGFDLVTESFDDRQVGDYDATVGAVLGEPGVYRKRFRDKRARSGGKEGLEVGTVEKKPTGGT